MASGPVDHKELPHWLKPVGIALLCAALVWLIAVRGYADYLSNPAPDRAARLNSSQPDAVSQLASEALDSGDLETAELLATRIAALYPFEGRALRVLGAIEERRGDQVRAEQLMYAAAQASPRDTATQYWLALRALSDQDLDQALKRLDRVLRFQPETMRELFPLLGTVGANPFGARKLLPYLSKNPAWRSQYITRFVREAQPLAAVLELERLLAGDGSPLTSEESGGITSRLLRGEDWQRLSERIAQRSGTSAQHLRDSRFAGDVSESLLAWSWRKVVGADIVFGALDDAGGSALRVYFHDRRVPFKHIRQLLLMGPGQYRIDGRVRLDDLETPRGMSWKLSCAGSGHALPLGESELFRGNSPWRNFTVSFEVPSQGCPAQWFSLELAARIPAEQQVDGSIWFTDVRVTNDLPLGGTGHAKPDAD